MITSFSSWSHTCRHCTHLKLHNPAYNWIVWFIQSCSYQYIDRSWWRAQRVSSLFGSLFCFSSMHRRLSHQPSLQRQQQAAGLSEKALMNPLNACLVPPISESPATSLICSAEWVLFVSTVGEMLGSLASCRAAFMKSDDGKTATSMAEIKSTYWNNNSYINIFDQYDQYDQKW